MTAQPPHIEKLADHLFRHESGKMVAVLTRIFGTENLELAEDVVQDTFISAMQVWRLKGLPDNPSAWLFRAAKNKAIDALRRNKFSKHIDFADPERKLLQSEYTLVSVMDTLWQEESIPDDLLRMMFACCNSGIAPENQVTLILKTLCGFSTAEIARAFLTSEDTISKRLYRTREFFREQKIRPEFPDGNDLRVETGAVLKSIYLLFNEGYHSASTDALIRKDLIAQAMYLCSLLTENKRTALPEVFATMALMSFHAARIESRMSSDGEIILLAEQDRSTWNRELITQGNGYLSLAASGGVITTYHIEAAIAYEHCSAGSYEATNWPHIRLLYDWLMRIAPSPVVALNRLVVIYKIEGAAAALSETENTPYRSALENNYLFHSLLGEMYAAGNPEQARTCFEKAIGLTTSDAEKRLLGKKRDALTRC